MTAALENILRRSCWLLTRSCRVVNTSLNDFVAPMSRFLRVSTTVAVCSAPCLDASSPPDALAPRAEASRILAARFWSSAMAVLRAVMSCLITAESSAISCAGSSNMPPRFASCARRSSFWLVPWMPWPMRLDIFANSELVPARSAPSEPPAPGSNASVGPSPARICVSPRAAAVFAARSHALANSRVRSRTELAANIVSPRAGSAESNPDERPVGGGRAAGARGRGRAPGAWLGEGRSTKVAGRSCAGPPLLRMQVRAARMRAGGRGERGRTRGRAA